jgi:hypothetical protein
MFTNYSLNYKKYHNTHNPYYGQFFLPLKVIETIFKGTNYFNNYKSSFFRDNNW